VAAQGGQRGAAGKGAGIEKIGALATGFEREAAEAQHVIAPRQVDEFALVGLHAVCFRIDARSDV
jgi:hypothetical protein